MHGESSRDRIPFFEALEIITFQIPSLLNTEDLNGATCYARTECRPDLISLTPIKYLNTAIWLRSNISIKEI